MARTSTKRTEPRPGKLVDDPTIYMFVTELALCRGNVGAAAKAVGWDLGAARKLVRGHPELGALAARAVQALAQRVATRWEDMHDEAIARIHELMYSEDHGTALAAAIYVVERNEGKIPTHVVEDHRSKLPKDALLVHFAMDLHFRKGLSLTQAIHYGKTHEEELRQWGAAEGLIAPETPADSE